MEVNTTSLLKVFSGAAAAIGLLCATAVTPSAADEQFNPSGVVKLPHAQILSAFDISFVDPLSRTLAVAASRVVGSGGAFGAVIIVNTDDNVVTTELTGFVGDCSVPPNRDTISGPNGVIVIGKGSTAQVWAADGPVFSTHCVPASGLKTPSTVKVFNLNGNGNGQGNDNSQGNENNSSAMIASIPTGTGAGTKTPGIRRADELCYNGSDVVLVANDDPLDNFITFINKNTFQVIQRIRFDGSDSDGNDPFKILANGIEQCIFNPRDGKFYLNIPNTVQGSNKTAPGVTVRISGSAPFQVEAVFDFSKPPLNTTGCTGGTGIALGPDGQLALSCGLIIKTNGAIVASFPSEGNADEVWFNPGTNHYFLANSTCKQSVTTTGCLGIIDAGPQPSADKVAGTAPGSHSVAADSFTNAVYVPIRGNNGTVPPSAGGTICGTANDVFGKAGSDALGCIAIYTAPSDADDPVSPPAMAIGNGNGNGNGQGNNNSQGNENN
jgi:hypothetical protein